MFSYVKLVRAMIRLRQNIVQLYVPLYDIVWYHVNWHLH